VAQLKRYLPSEVNRINLYDLVMGETERLKATISDTAFPVRGQQYSPNELATRVARYEACSEVLLAMMITGCYWGERAHESLWTRSLEVLSRSV
jgi:hypothetical protein